MQPLDTKDFVIERLMIAARATPVSECDNLWGRVDARPLRTQAEFFTVEGLFEARVPAWMQEAQPSMPRTERESAHQPSTRPPDRHAQQLGLYR